MGVTTTQTNKPFNPRGNDQSPLAFNRAKLYSGKALDFDGVNDKVTTTYASGFTGAQEFTYCAYINTDTNQDSQAIIHADENAGWGLQSLQIRTETNGIRFLAGTGSAATSYVDSEVVEANKWYFVVGTHTPTENKIYLNGVLNATATANNLTIAPDAIIVGAYPASANPYNGEISNVKVFNTALTAAQVADLYNNPELVVPTGVANTALKLWLPMQEGAGTTAYDGSGNGNHGTISGATYTHGIGAPVSQTAVIDWNKGSNIFTYSEALSNWTQFNTITTDDSAISPDGSQNASKLVATSGINNNVIYQGITAGTYTASIFAKKGEFEGIVIATGNNGAFFNLNTNTYRTYYGSAPTSYNIEDFGNGWHRFSITFTEAGANNIYIGPNDNVSNTLGVTGNNSDGIYIFGAQLEQASSVGPYVRTGATAQTSEVLLPQGLTTGRDITGVNLFENVRKQGALNLDGNSWAEVHDNASLDVTDAITLEAWVYWDTAQAGIMGRWGATTPTRNYMLYVENATKVRFYINTSYSEYTSMTTGWHHIVGTYDKTNMRLFVDGTQVAAAAQTAAITTSSEVLEIGRYRYGSDLNKEYNNPIAQPRIYNRALTAEEVQRNYNAGKNTYTN